MYVASITLSLVWLLCFYCNIPTGKIRLMCTVKYFNTLSTLSITECFILCISYDFCMHSVYIRPGTLGKVTYYSAYTDCVKHVPFLKVKEIKYITKQKIENYSLHNTVCVTKTCTMYTTWNVILSTHLVYTLPSAVVSIKVITRNIPQ